MANPRARLDDKRRKAISARLRDGYTIEDLQLAIFGCSVSPFHQGQNDRGRAYQDIALICRDAEHVDHFIALAEKTIAREKAKQHERLMDKPASPIPDNIRAMVKR